MAVSNAPELSRSREGGLDVHRFAPTLPLPTYLMAMMVGPFAMRRGRGAADPAARPAAAAADRLDPGRTPSKLGFALEGSHRIVALLEDYFGDAFPYPKLDQITSPIMPGAMENAGADLYAGRAAGASTRAHRPTQKRAFGMVVAHELAHQWFGDLVTPAWWDDIWLNESFANWMGYRIGDDWRPDLNIGAGALAEGFAAMNTDALLAGRPIHQPIETNGADRRRLRQRSPMARAARSSAMIAAFMGDEQVPRRRAPLHGRAPQRQRHQQRLLRALWPMPPAIPRILPAMQSFTDQQGVPLLTFPRRLKARSALHGRRRAATRRSAQAAPGTRWGVPMCLRRGGARELPAADRGARRGDDRRLRAADPQCRRHRLLPLRAAASRIGTQLIAAAHKLDDGEAQALADSLTASFRAGRSEVAPACRAGRAAGAPPRQLCERCRDPGPRGAGE